MEYEFSRKKKNRLSFLKCVGSSFQDGPPSFLVLNLTLKVTGSNFPPSSHILNFNQFSL